jgi:type I restriction enzyme S subunit
MNPTGFADALAPGALPKGWIWASLADIARINPPLDERIVDDARSVTFVPMAAVDEGFGGVQRPSSRPFGEVKKGYTPFQVHDIIMAKITPCMENGKGGVVKGADGEVFFGSTEFHVLRPYPGILPQWVGAFLAQERVRRAARLGMKGSAGQLRVPEEFLHRLHLPLASSAEQARIADRIDELLTDLAAGVVALERVKKKLKRYRQAVLHAAVTGRLTAQWRKTHGPPIEPGEKLLARVLVERRQKWEARTLAKFAAAKRIPPKDWQTRYVEPSAPKTGNLPKLPEEWCYGTLDQLTDVTGGVAKNEKEAGGEGMRVVPYLRVANVQRGYLDLSEIKSISAREADITELRLLKGDVLFTEGGDRDKLGRGWVWAGEIAECIHQNHIFRARLFVNDLFPELLSYSGNSYGQEWFRQNGKQSVNLASISLGVLRQFPVPVIPVDEQDAVVEAVNEKLSQIDAMEVEVVRGLARATRLQQAIFNAAFAGELLPQDPNEEPASKLLERIRSAKAAAELVRQTPATRRKKVHEPVEQ